MAVSGHAQQNNPDVNPQIRKSARLLTEDQINTYWAYAQERLSQNDLRTAMATLYFLVNAQGLTEEMLETVDQALLQAIKKQKDLRRDMQPPAGVKPSPGTATSVTSTVPTVMLEEVSSTNTGIAAGSPEPQSNSMTTQSTDSADEQNITDSKVAASIDDAETKRQIVDKPALSPEADQKVTNIPTPVTAQNEGIPTQTADPESERESANAVSEDAPVTSVPITHSDVEKVVTELPVSAEKNENTEDDDSVADPDFAVELSVSREATNNSFSNTASSRSSDSTADLAISLQYNFTQMLSGILELSIPINEVESTIEADESYLQFLFTSDIYSGDVTLGTQSISEERGWMFDSTLDLIGTSLSTGHWNLSFGLGVETQNGFWSEFFEPEDDPIYRWIGEYSHQLSEFHRLSIFLTGLKDESAATDDVTSDLNWIGARSNGSLWRNNDNQLDYWIDIGSVSGNEQIFITDEDDAGVSTQQLESDGRVRGWGYDLGATWWTNLPGKPEFTISVAGTSKDSDPGDGTDESYRQTGLQGNSADIGSATDLSFYGLVLDPELSNLQIKTAGITFPLKSSSYLAFMYHEYQQRNATTELRDSSLDLTLTATNKEIGQALDVVVSYEESEDWSITLSAGFFEAGKGAEQPDASAYYGAVDLSYDF